MARTMTPQRQELREAAKRLRQAKWSQAEIGRALAVPQRTISRWLIMASNIPSNGKPLSNLANQTTPIVSQNHHKPITLFPCKYEDVGGGIAPGSIDLILTDPPYLISSENLTRPLQKTDLRRDYGKWDKGPLQQYERNVGTWAQLMGGHLKQGGALYCFMDTRRFSLWHDALEGAGLTYQNVIIWHRKNPAPQLRQTKWCHAFDSILYFTKGSPTTFNWWGLNNMHNVIVGPICQGAERTSHPTQKPRWLLTRLLLLSSRYGDTILDPFAGSGTSAFAGYGLGRKYILVEPDPQYAGLIQGRAREEFDWEAVLHG